MPSSEVGTSGLGRKMVKGGFILILLRLSIRLIGLVSTIILFRILVPEDFGLVALAMVVVGLAEVLAEFGFEQTLLRNKHAVRSDYDVAWSLTFLRGIVVATILLLIAEPAAQYLNEPHLQQIVYWLALIPLLDGVANIGIIDFTKYFQFGKDYALKVSQKLISFCLTLYFAYTLRNYWALVIGILSGKAVGLVLGYLMHPYRPRFSLKGARAVFSFSVWIFVNHLTLYGGNQADKVMIQKYYDAHMVGIFRVAEEICSIVMELVWPVERALYAGYAQLADDFEALRKTVLDSTGLVAMIGVPMSIGILLVAEPAVAILLGDKGKPAVPFVQILVLHGAIRSCSAGAMPAFMVLGKPQINTQFTLMAVTTRLSVLFVCFPMMGVMVAPWSLVAGSFISFMAVWIQLKRHLSLRWLDYPAAMWRTVVATCIMISAVEPIHLIPLVRELLSNDWLHLLIKITVGILVYALSVMILWVFSGRPNGPESHFLKLTRSIISRWRSAV